MSASAYRPFLLLSSRAEHDAAVAELESFRTKMGLKNDEIIQHRLESKPLGEVTLEDYSGIVLGGSPFNISDAEKSEVQLRVEADIARLMEQVLAKDFPLFGACYGVGAVGTAIEARIDLTYGESADVVPIKITEAGLQDPVLAGMPEIFHSLVGHKEAISELPSRAVILAAGENCPVQMFRVGKNVFATQFHPELDPDTFAHRLQVYADRGYYDLNELDAILDRTARADLSIDDTMLHNFAQIYKRV